MDEDDLSKKHKGFEIGQDLSDVSVDELGELIIMLEEEISRLKEAQSSKSGHLSAAEALFKTKT